MIIDDPKITTSLKETPEDHEAYKMMTDARARLTIASPFFSALAFFLKLYECNDDKVCATCGTDGDILIYNPLYIRTLSKGQAIGLWIHELIHCVQMASQRRSGREKERWEISTDIATDNLILDFLEGDSDSKSIIRKRNIQIDFVGDDKRKNTVKNYKGLTSEQVYEKLPPMNYLCPSCGSGNVSHEVIDKSNFPVVKVESTCGECGEKWEQEATVTPSMAEGEGDESNKQQIEGLSPKDFEGWDQHYDKSDGSAKDNQMANEWKRRVSQAVMAAKSRGTEPGAFEGILEGVDEPFFDWKRELMHFIQTMLKDRQRWIPPNKRYLHAGLILPSMKSEGLGSIAVMMDVSGSVGDKEVSLFISELQGILDSYDMTLHVIQHDHVVQKHDKYTHGMEIGQVEIIGRGGTSHKPVFAYVREKFGEGCGEELTCIIGMSDMASDYPEEPPDVPLLWVVTPDYSKESVPSYGQVMKLHAP